MKLTASLIMLVVSAAFVFGSAAFTQETKREAKTGAETKSPAKTSKKKDAKKDDDKPKGQPSSKSPKGTPKALANLRGLKPIDVKVLVLNFDPVVVRATQARLTTVARWNNSRILANAYAEDVKAASGGLVRFKMVDWLELDEFPVLTDGFTNTPEEYMKDRQAKGQAKVQAEGQAGRMADYPKVIARHKIVERVEKGEVDEVWWFGGPGFGFYENAMAGQGAFNPGGGAFGTDKVPCKRAFVIVGFNYERTDAEMLHNLCHRAEATMARIFGGWGGDHDWARFSAYAKQSKGFAGVGNCHYPPNGDKDYDYGNKQFVESTADDWLAYPNLTGVKKRLNCDAWGGNQGDYLTWWFAHLPRAPGVNPNGRLNNWWEYIFHFNDYDDRARPPRPVDYAAERVAAEWIVAAGGSVTIERDSVPQDVKSAADLPDGQFAITAIALVDRPLKDGDLAHFAGLKRVTRLDLRRCTVTDAALTHLKDLESLRWLCLNRTRVTGTGLPELKGLRLEYLELLALALTDRELAQMPAFPELRELHLSETKVTNAGMHHLKNRIGMHKLGLAGTAVTDEGLMSLAGLKDLEFLLVGGSDITDEGVEKLKRTAPNVKAVR